MQDRTGKIDLADKVGNFAVAKVAKTITDKDLTEEKVKIPDSGGKLMVSKTRAGNILQSQALSDPQAHPLRTGIIMAITTTQIPHQAFLHICPHSMVPFNQELTLHPLCKTLSTVMECDYYFIDDSFAYTYSVILIMRGKLVTIVKIISLNLYK